MEQNKLTAVVSNCAAKRKYGTLTAMLRAQAVLVIIALLATPLALLARATDPNRANCDGMCCLPHGHHAPQHVPSHHAAHVTPRIDASCGHDDAVPAPALSCMLDCTMHSSPRGSSFGLLAPIAPTRASSIFSLRLPLETQPKVPGTIEFLGSGFLPSPFQPPRA
jgi:hypothetical protein